MSVTKATDTRFDANIQSWDLISKMLTGEGVKTTLTRGAYEAKRAFQKRKQNADFKPYTRDLISRLTGELFSRGGEISRDTKVSEDYRSNIGPNGESYQVQLINAAEVLTAFHEVWLVMDPAQGLLVTEPQFITRSTDDAVVVKGKMNIGGGSVFSNETQVEAWTVYYDNSYKVYVKDEENNDNPEKMVDDGFYYEEDWSFQGGPPVVQITLPWRVKFGLSVARTHRALYRLESKYDAALTNSLMGLIQIATGGDDEMRDKIADALKDGAVGIPYDKDSGEHKPLNVGTAGLKPGAEALKRKRKELYHAAYQSLDQASKRMTATEAEARNRMGPAAALSVLAETMQSLEESILPFIAQAEDSRRATENLTPSVSWPIDFSSNRDQERLVQDIFGGLGLPVDVNTATDVVVEYLEDSGFSSNREDIQQEIQKRKDLADQSPTNDQFL
ncbi:hypothetical protein OSG_eHP25_00060 [environmental Halophage eHP-25]|nr:hypothetical protein OSG_eHP25_00060 [environmental Halophage eHP-25]